MPAAHDVLIAGAGPAGSIAALILARAGARVRLIDRAKFPRYKLCGDTINPGALALLDRLGVGARVREAGVAVPGMVVSGPGGRRLTSDYADGRHGIAITRDRLDAILLDEAVRAGAGFEPELSVRSPRLDARGRVCGVDVAARGGRRELAARLVIAAEGRASRLAASLGLCRFARWPRRWAFGAYYADVAGLTAHGEMHLRNGGYVGIAPMPHGTANVCVVRHANRVYDVRREPARAIEDAIAADPMLRARFDAARRVSAVSVLGPLAVESRAAGTPGLLLAGDAAGFIDPMTGDGLRFAIRGAELAAQGALQELASGAPAHVWLAAARAEEFTPKWRLNRLLRRLVASRTALHAAALVAGRWPAPVRLLVNVAGDVALARRIDSAS